MKLEVSKIHSSAADLGLNSNQYIYGPTDIIVMLTNEQKYLASFFSYTYLQEIFKEKPEDESTSSGSYFWGKRIVVVKNCRIETIEKVVNHLLAEGEFLEVFEQL